MKKALLLFFILCFPLAAAAQTAEELRVEIENHNAQLEALDAEIAQYEKELETIGAQKQTLQNTIDQLNVQRRKLTAQISATRNRIGKLQLEIQSLSDGIGLKEGSIRVEQAGIAEVLRRLNEAERRSFIVSVLSSEDISSVWQDVDASYSLKEALRDDIAALAAQKNSLAETKAATEGKRTDLVREQNTLVAEQGSLDATRKAQNELLSETKSQESSYQTLLKEKQAAKANFESALSDLQTRLQYTIDPSLIPSAGKGILRWPVDTVKVTQYFGNTAFAQSGAYAGRGHNGIDLRAAIGTPIRAALTGTVLATGNTDATRGCYSYGKWIMVKHANGLSTLYAHLSDIKVSKGESVATGELVGYSGASGYATGPHLHFGVYVSEAVQIIRLGEATNRATPCSSAVMPVAPLSGYLNPVDYL